MTATDDPSGALAAAAAHDAGAVTATAARPVQGVTVEFRVHGSARDALELADGLADLLTRNSLVLEPVTTSVVER